MGDGILSGPHEFRPIRFWDNWAPTGRCQHCMATKHRHPMSGWVEARPWRSKKPSVDGITEYFR